MNTGLQNLHVGPWLIQGIEFLVPYACGMYLDKTVYWCDQCLTSFPKESHYLVHTSAPSPEFTSSDEDDDDSSSDGEDDAVPQGVQRRRQVQRRMCPGIQTEHLLFEGTIPVVEKNSSQSRRASASASSTSTSTRQVRVIELDGSKPDCFGGVRRSIDFFRIFLDGKVNTQDIHWTRIFLLYELEQEEDVGDVGKEEEEADSNPPPRHPHGGPWRLAGYFSKRVNRPMESLSCIVVLPPYRTRGYGRFLMSLSYELCRRRGDIGTPERPLSASGLALCRSVWWNLLQQFLLGRSPLMKLPGGRDPPLTCSKNNVVMTRSDGTTLIAMAKATGIAPYDIHDTLVRHGVLKSNRRTGGSSAILLIDDLDTIQKFVLEVKLLRAATAAGEGKVPRSRTKNEAPPHLSEHIERLRATVYLDELQAGMKD